MPGEPRNVPPVKAEPKTALGEFFRAHRTEVLAGAGILVAGYAYYRSKHPSASSAAAQNASAATTAAGATGAIDPNTGVPYATELANAEAQGVAVTSPASQGSGSTTGYGDGGGTGYSNGSGYGADIYSELQGIQTTLANQGQLTQVPNAAPGPSPSPITSVVDGFSSPSITPNPIAVAGAHQAAVQAAAATTAKNLAKDKALAAKNPSAKNVAAVKALTSRLKKET